MLKQIIPYMNAERKLNGRLISVMIICSLLIPVILVLSISTYDFYFGMPEAAFITAGVFVIACVFFIIRLFRENHAQHKADTILALPFTAKQRYTAKVLLITEYCILPSVICSLLSIVSVYAVSKKLDLWHGNQELFMLSLYAAAFITAVVFICSAAVVCCVCTSSKGAAAALTAALTAVVSLLPLSLADIIKTAQGWEVVCTAILPVNMFGLGHLQLFFESDFNDRVPKVILDLWLTECGVNILLSCTAAAAAYRLYAQRCAVNVSESRTEKRAMSAISAFAEFSMISIFVALGAGLTGATIALGIMIAFVFIINRRSIRLTALKKGLITYGCAVAVFLVFYVFSFYTDGLYTTSAPDRLEYFDGNEVVIYFEDDNTTVTFKDMTREEIEQAVKTVGSHSSGQHTVSQITGRLFLGYTHMPYKADDTGEECIEISVFGKYEVFDDLWLGRFNSAPVPKKEITAIVTELEEKFGDKMIQKSDMSAYEAYISDR